jgi:N4-gp56 family major capsid protein
MARSTMSTSDALRKQQWEEKLYRDTVKKSFFMGGRFTGGGRDSSSTSEIVNIKTNLEAKGKTRTRPGDKLTFGIRMRIDPRTNPGVISGQKLKGKEVALTHYSFSVELERYRQAVSQGSPIDWQRSAYSIPEEARSALEDWGSEKLDLLAFDALGLSAGSSVNPSRIVYKTSAGVTTATATAATAKSALDATESKLTPEMVSWMYTHASTGGDRDFVPLRPVKVDGEDYLVLLTHPDALYDWANDPTVAQAHRDAMERGKSNPLFRGAKYIWNNVIIFGHENVEIRTDGGAGAVAWCRGILMGAQALVWAWGERPSIVEDTEDYEEDHFVAWRITAKAKKPVFNSIDYGSLGFYVARTQVSDVI